MNLYLSIETHITPKVLTVETLDVLLPKMIDGKESQLSQPYVTSENVNPDPF